jgi:hypothetical protein
MPGPGHPRYEAMLADLRRLFEQHQVDGKLALDLVTMVYVGRLQ